MTLSILDINELKKETKRYLIFSIFILIFGIIYEIFSHGVYTPYMYLAFLIPFIFGVILKKILITVKAQIPVISDNLYNSFINTLTIGLIFNGVLIIYGTTNKLIIIYFITSILLLVLSVLFTFTKKVFDE